MEPGQIVCLKSTGELCVVLGENDDGVSINIRRPKMSHEDGINHEEMFVYPFELETVEEHLRREAKEMVLKVKIQEEMQEEIDRTKKKPADVLVN